MLAAARDLIDERGVNFTMDALAERAGVAVGTLYRHYPTKNDLVSAVLDEAITAIADVAEQGERAVAAGAPAGPTLEGMFARIADSYAGDAPVKHAAAALGMATDIADLTRRPDSPAERAAGSIGAILQAAQRSGYIRPDVTLADLIMLVASAPDAQQVGIDARSRYVAIVLAGIRQLAP